MSAFIVFEGIDGCGKSTQASLLADALNVAGVEVMQTREPGGSLFAEEIRKLLLASDIEALTELMLLSAARRDHVVSLIKPAMARGAVVICDRFYGSTFAYQCYGKKVPLPLARYITDGILDGLHPNLTFLLDVNPEIAKERRMVRVGQENHYDQRDLGFHRDVRYGFLEIAKIEAGWYVLDAMQSKSELAHQIYSIVGKELKL